MKKKILTKHILMALVMASLFPLGAGASVEFENDTLILNSYAVKDEKGEVTFYDQLKSDPNQNVTYTDTKTEQTRAGNSFTNIVVNVDEHTYEGHRGNYPYSFRFNGEQQNVTVNVTGSSNATNSDGIHLTNWAPHFVAKSYTANIGSPNSDALNISHDAQQTADEGQPYATIGALTAIVSNGNGIRANSSIHNSTDTSTITVTGKTDITINSDPITVYKQEHKEFGDSSLFRIEVDANASTTYNPAAVYAGDDMYSLQIGGYGMGGQSVGKGIIDLQGDTTLSLNGEGNYGVYAGKNGSIDVNNISITSGGKKFLRDRCEKFKPYLWQWNRAYRYYGYNISIWTSCDYSVVEYVIRQCR